MTVTELREQAFNTRCPECRGGLYVQEGDRFASGERSFLLRCSKCWGTFGAYIEKAPVAAEHNRLFVA